jgi:hypothetical protein
MADERIQCQLCLDYHEAHEFTEVCPECLDNSASYDITVRDRRVLLNAVSRAVKLLQEPSITNVSEAVGMLAAVKLQMVK